MTQEIESIGLKMDTSGVERGIRSLDELASRGPKVEKSLKGIEGAAQGLSKVSDAARSATSSQEALARAVAGFSGAEREYVQALVSEYKQLTMNRGERAAYIAQSKGMSQSAQEIAKAVGLKIDAYKQEQAALEQSARAQNSAAASSMALAKSAVLAVAGGAMFREYMQAADAITTLNNQLKLATGSTDAAQRAYTGLYEVAQRARVSFTDLGSTYASIARATGEMGISQQRMLKVTESIANAMTISGGSASSMQAALVQLSQGFASGTLRGEELNSVMEQTPRLARAIADGMGISIGKLRELGSTGMLTSEAVVKALESQSAVLAKEVSGATLTVGQAFTQLSNASTNAIGEFDKASGSSQAFAQAISGIAGAMDGLGRAFSENKPVIETTMGALTGAAALATLGAIPRAITAIGAAVTGLSAVLAANPVVLTLLGVGAVVGGGVAALKAHSQTADGIRAAIERLQGENERSEAAMQRAMDGGRTAGADQIRKTIQERTKAISAMRDELLKLEIGGQPKGAGGGRGSINPMTTIEMAAQDAKDNESLIAARQKLYGVDKNYLANLSRLNGLYERGKMGIDEYRSAVTKLANENFKSEKITKSNASKLLASETKADISAVKAQMEQLTGIYSGSEAIMEQARRSGLMDEREYYQAKLSFINLNIDAKKRELEQENAILAAKNVTGPQAIDRDRKIAENKAKINRLMQDGAMQTEVLTRQADAALQAQAASLLSAEQAAQDYLNTLQRGFDRDVLSVGMGSSERNIASGRQQIEDRYASQRQNLANQRALATMNAGGTLTAEAKKHYDDLLAINQRYEELALSSYTDGVARRLAAEYDWRNGAKRAFKDYASSAANVAQQTADMFSNAFKGMEDSLVNFAMTGKASFGDLARSIIADLIRIQIRAQLSGVFGSLMGALGGVGGNAGYGDYSSAGLSAAFGFASGGYTGPGARNEPAGIVHRGEYVINAESTRKIGLGYLSRLNGYANGGFVGGSSPVPGGVVVNINTQSGLQVEQTGRRGADGTEIIDVFIKQAAATVAGQISGRYGPVHQAIVQRERS